jgi:hypothetical protein
MAAIAGLLSHASGTDVSVATLKTVALFCVVGLRKYRWSLRTASSRRRNMVGR